MGLGESRQGLDPSRSTALRLLDQDAIFHQLGDFWLCRKEEGGQRQPSVSGMARSSSFAEEGSSELG